MKYEPPLVPATLVKRYKRFLADVIFEDGSTATVHTPNTGSMMGCADADSRIWVRDCASPKRKLPWSWEITENHEGTLIGVNTSLANQLVREGVETGVIEELQGYETIRQEVRYGNNSRIDLLLERQTDPQRCYVEVKNVTLASEQGCALFPDAVSTRATKHLEELMEMVRQGHRGVLVFCVQRTDAERFAPADHIDPQYGKTLRKAMAAGVEALAYQARVTPESINLYTKLPVVTD